jgi:type IX secretion system PorP/SprF family membrane protein
MFSRTEVDLNQLSFGLSFGLIQSKLDETQFDPLDFDPIIAGIIQSSSYFNVDAGVSYNFLNFSGHFTVKNIIFQSREINSADYESSNQRKFIISGAYAFANYGSSWTYEPSLMYQIQERTKEQLIDVNGKVYRAMDFGKLWGGLSYRRSFDGAEYLNGIEVENQKLQYLTAILGVSFNKFLFAYTYSNQMGNVKFSNGSFHQITLGFDFLGSREPYDCNCPAIN